MPKYSLNKIRRKYTYTAQDIADLYGIGLHTVFRWIKNQGLVRIPKTKKYYVHGSELYTFIKRKNAKNKRPCKDNEIYCFKCRCPRTPNTDIIKPLPNKTVRVLGNCGTCNTKMNKVISGKTWIKNHPFYPTLDLPINTPNGEHELQHKCQHKVGE